MHKKTVAIVTLQSYLPNYGNKLQSYAVQVVFQKLGYKTIILTWKNVYSDRINEIKEKVKYILFRLTGKTFGRSQSYWLFFLKKVKNFQNFDKRYLFIKNYRNDDNLNKHYDFFLSVLIRFGIQPGMMRHGKNVSSYFCPK